MNHDFKIATSLEQHKFVADHNIAFFSDPGHGWLRVPRHLLKTLQISDKISGYSYQDTDYAYLEEDCDISIFLRALSDDVEVQKVIFRMAPDRYEEKSTIRNKKAQYKPTKPKAIAQPVKDGQAPRVYKQLSMF